MRTVLHTLITFMLLPCCAQAQSAPQAKPRTKAAVVTPSGSRTPGNSVPKVEIEAKTVELLPGPRATEVAPKWKAKHPDTAFRAQFVPDGSRVCTAGFDKTIRMWDAVTGKEVWKGQHPREVVSLAVSSDGKLVASGDGMMDRLSNNKECGVQIWDATRGAALKQFRPEGISVRQLAFRSDRRTLLVVAMMRKDDKDKISFELWDALTGKKLERLPLEGGEGFNTFAASQDGKWVVGGNGSGDVRLWNLETKTLAASLDVHGRINGVAFSPTSQSVAVTFAGSGGGGLVLWDITLAQAERFLRTGQEFDAISFSPDGNLLVYENEGEKNVSFFDCKQRKVTASIAYPNAVIQDTVFSPAGKGLVVLDGDVVSLFDLSGIRTAKAPE
jgi:WD40 repeat protein